MESGSMSWVCGAGLAVMLGVSTAARGQVVVDGFEGGVNLGGWTYGGPFGGISGSGGNPGGYWNEPDIDTFAPQLRTTTPGSVFLGDYRGRQVSGLSVDLITFDVDFSAAGRPLSLMLGSDNGTPGNFNDDWAAFTMNALEVPQPGEGWRSFEFDVPSGSAALPAGWEFVEFGPGANPDWNTLIGGVDEVRFFYGDPRNFFIFQMWDLGADNVAIETIPGPWGLGVVMMGIASGVSRRRRL